MLGGEVISNNDDDKKRKLWLFTFYASFGLAAAEKEKEKQGKKMYLPIVYVELVAWFGLGQTKIPRMKSR